MPKNDPPTSATLYPLFWLAVCFAFGILVAKYFVFDQRITLVSTFVFATLTVVFIKQKFSAVFLFAGFIFLGAFCFQMRERSVAEHRIKLIYEQNQIVSDEPVEIEGILRGKPELAAQGFFLLLEAEKINYKNRERKVSGRVRFFAAAESENIAAAYERMNLRYGAKIRVACRPRREENYLNPGMISRRAALDQQGIDATAVIKSPLLIEKLGDAEEFAPLAWIYEQRENLIIEFREKFSSPTSGILIASLLGNKYFLDRGTAEIFRAGGTFHVLVISGLHVTFIGGLTLLFLRFFTAQRFWQFVVASAFLWTYSIAVGADVPVVRATVMFTILLFSQVIYRNGTLLNSFGAGGLMLLVWKPSDLFNPSFQLTFVSVAAIVVMAFPLIENLRRIGSWSPTTDAPFPPRVSGWLKKFCEMLYWREAVWQIERKGQIWSANLFKSPPLKWFEANNVQTVGAYIFEGVLVSLIVQIWLLPLLIVYFHRVSPISIGLNLWVGFFIALESFSAVGAVFLAQLSDVLALPMIKLTELFNQILLSVPSLFVENEWASFRVPAYSGAMSAVYYLYYLPIFTLTIILFRWKPFELSAKLKIENSKFGSLAAFLSFRAAASALLIFIGLIIFHPFSAPRADGRLRVDFLDVGQGDSALITFPNGETLLVDGGGKNNFQKDVAEDAETNDYFEPDVPTIGEQVVSAFLWKKGYSRIDYLLATHADTDHIQGLSDVAKNFRVRAALFGKTPLKDANFTELYEVLQKRGVSIVKLARGDVLNFEKVRIEVLSPAGDDSSEAVSDNNNSLVLRISYGARKILLNGDIEKETEAQVLQRPAFLQADVVKVAHHGSRTSSTQSLIDATNAVYAVISVGRRSPFDHPHAEVVERWINSGARVLTTGERGTVSISTDGSDLEIQTFIK